MNGLSSEVIMALIGLGSSLISSVVTWTLAKRKYNSEVDTIEIQNLKDALDFYKTVLEDNQRLLHSYMHRVEQGMLEIHNLRKAVTELLRVSCTDTTCTERVLIESEIAKTYLGISDETTGSKTI